MTTDIAQNGLDEKLLRWADHMSPEQISEKLGGTLSPAKVRLRIEELVGTTFWLDDAKREQITLWKMHRLLERIENMIGAEFDLDNMKLQLATLKEIGNRLDKRRAALDVDLERYDRNVALEMVRVFDLSMAYLKGALRGDIDPDHWDQAVRDALMHAQAEVMKKAIDA